MELSTITKSQESDTDTETPLLQTHLSRALSLHHHPPPPPPPVMVVSYKECLKNHAATLGGLALDGCGEFLPTTTTPSSDHDPTASLKCAACGCHRNFHRREPSGLPLSLPPVRQYWTTSRSPSPSPSLSPSSNSPTPQQSVFPGAPAHMLMALSAAAGPQHCGALENQNQNRNRNKRSRTKFTEEQKEKMYLFAEKLGWKMIRANDEDKRLDDFCSEIGVKRNVFKVWMHNNKQRIKDNKVVLINGSSN